MKDLTQEPRFATLPDQLIASLDAVEAMVARQESADSTKLEHARRNLQSTVEQAQALKVQYEAVQGRFGPMLKRMAQVKVHQLRIMRGYNLLGDVAEDAKRALANLRTAITQLEGIPAAVEGLSLKDLAAGGAEQITTRVTDLVGGPTRLVDKCQDLLKRLASFEVAQKS